MRDYTKFFTYPDTANFMTVLLHPKPGQMILEPSAGNGALVKAVKQFSPHTYVSAVEVDPQWSDELKQCADIYSISDFLSHPANRRYDGCIANPPFGNETDLQAHFDKMCSLVKPQGRMVLLLPDDFELKIPHVRYPLENWSSNKDGTTTPIKVVVFHNIAA